MRHLLFVCFRFVVSVASWLWAVFGNDHRSAQRVKRSYTKQFCSIELKLRLPTSIVCKRRLVMLIEHTRFQNQKVHLCPHEAAITICRRTDNRFAANIEAGVYDHRATGFPPEGLDDFPVEWICFTPHSLNARRIIHMR